MKYNCSPDFKKEHEPGIDKRTNDMLPGGYSEERGLQPCYYDHGLSGYMKIPVKNNLQKDIFKF